MSLISFLLLPVIIGGLELLRSLLSWCRAIRKKIFWNSKFLRLNKYVSIFHILDTLSKGTFEASCLEKTILKHFEGVAYEGGRIKINLAKVSAIIPLWSSISSLNNAGAPSTKFRWLRLFLDLFRQEVSQQSWRDASSHKGQANDIYQCY